MLISKVKWKEVSRSAYSLIVGILFVFLALFEAWTQKTYAGIFSIPHFVPTNEFAIGLEPGLNMTGGASLDMNLKYTQGLSELNNLTGIIGTGGGNRQFRVGGALSFDFFPDIENQPGIGLAVQGLYVELKTAGSVEVTGAPYIHKTFKIDASKADSGIIEPFVALPIGLSLSNGSYQPLATIVVGSLYQHSEHLRSVFEFGVAINNATSYISGGLVYYH